ncbi:MAG: methyltransferase domain-containing protein [Candidatus Sulfotelmatobacter sp.]
MLSRVYRKIQDSRTSFFREQLETWLAKIDVDAHAVLDAGGGARPVKNRVRSWNVSEYVILDNRLQPQKTEPTIIADLNKSFSCENGPDAMDRIGTFDVVFCLEVMECIWNPLKALENLNLLLQKGGRLYISFPFVYPMHYPAGHDFMRYTQEGVHKLLLESGFEVNDVSVRRIRNEKLLAAAYAADHMHDRRDETIGHTGYCVSATKPKL